MKRLSFIMLFVCWLCACKKDTPIHRFPDGTLVRFNSSLTSWKGRPPFTVMGLFGQSDNAKMNFYVLRDADGLIFNNVEDDVLMLWKP